jgi:hypothetical protein
VHTTRSPGTLNVQRLERQIIKWYWKQECYARGKEPCIESRSAMPEGKNLVLEAGVLCPREIICLSNLWTLSVPGERVVCTKLDIYVLYVGQETYLI